MLARYEMLRLNIDDTGPKVAQFPPTAAKQNAIRVHTAA